MLGARVACLMFFARVFNWWVCGVAGEQKSSCDTFASAMHIEVTALVLLFLCICRLPLAHSFILAHIPAARHLHWSLVLACF